MSESLKGKIALITGAASGMGKATAELFAQEGASVGLVDIDSAALTTVARDIRGTGGSVCSIMADVRSVEQVEDAALAVGATLGPIDILLNAAGLQAFQRLEEVTEAQWDLAFDVNMKGTMLMSRAVAPGMVVRGQGSIINIASLAAWSRGWPGTSPYGASKYAVLGFSRYLATELRPRNIKVTCLCPGSTNTHFRGEYVNPDWMSAQDIAETVLFVATRPGNVWIAEMGFSSLKENW